MRDSENFPREYYREVLGSQLEENRTEEHIAELPVTLAGPTVPIPYT